ncbi:AraC family transcriptional regulator [Methylorubrum extorquens]|uniref:AraC family transcriptional regulator n=1 Tax=Methylorubrum extorquens TaxID=408 RepID=UPI003F5E9B3E
MAERIDCGVMISTSGEASGNGFAIGRSDAIPSVAGRGLVKANGHRGGRVGTCKELSAVLRTLRFEPEVIIAQVGLDSRLLEAADNALSTETVGWLLDTCVEQTGCRHVGLLMGARAKSSCFGVVGLLMHHLPTVSDSLRCLIEHAHLYQPDVISTLEVREGIAMLCVRASPADAKGGIQIADGALASRYRIMQSLCGTGWAPSEVLISHPSGNDEAAYHRVFQVPVRFDQEESALVFEARWLAQPVAGADPGFRNILELQVGELEQRDDDALSSRLRRSLRTLLLREGCSAQLAANLFAMHQRTMSRRLRAEGHSFQHLVDEVRYDIARHHLANANMPLGEVAVALGYSEASAFTRAFKRWSGLNPKAWRDARRADLMPARAASRFTDIAQHQVTVGGTGRIPPQVDWAHQNLR